MESPTELKSGYLSIHHKGLLGGSWNRKWCILVTSNSSSPASLNQHDSHKNLSKHPKTIDLSKISAVKEGKKGTCTFEVMMKKESQIFRCENQDDEQEWIKAFQKVMNLNGVDRSSKISTVSGEMIIDENHLYESADKPVLFKVKVNENEHSKRLKLSTEDDYYLAVFFTNIGLLNKQQVILFQWPYQDIKNFGRLPDTFQINTGRRTVTGHGIFSFQTTESNEIFEIISKNTKTARAHGSNDSLSSKPSPKIKIEEPKFAEGKPSPVVEESAGRKPLLKSESTESQTLVKDENFKQNLKAVLTHQKSFGEEEAKPLFKGSTESQINTDKKSLKRDKERERKEKKEREREEARRLKDEAIRIKEEAKRKKEEAKKKEKEKNKEKKHKSDKIQDSSPETVAHPFCPVDTYEDIDDIRQDTAKEAGARKLPALYSEPVDAKPKIKIENQYSEPENVQPSLKKPIIYSTAEQERTEGWKEFGQETANFHEEDYENIKIAANNKKFLEGDYDLPEEAPLAPLAVPDDFDTTYDHISSFKKPITKESVESENIYGDQSGTKITIKPPSASANEYEEATTVTVKSLN